MGTRGQQIEKRNSAIAASIPDFREIIRLLIPYSHAFLKWLGLLITVSTLNSSVVSAIQTRSVYFFYHGNLEDYLTKARL